MGNAYGKSLLHISEPDNPEYFLTNEDKKNIKKHEDN